MTDATANLAAEIFAFIHRRYLVTDREFQNQMDWICKAASDMGFDPEETPIEALIALWESNYETSLIPAPSQPWQVVHRRLKTQFRVECDLLDAVAQASINRRKG